VERACGLAASADGRDEMVVGRLDRPHRWDSLQAVDLQLGSQISGFGRHVGD
jgi:hypothetical protein